MLSSGRGIWGIVLLCRDVIGTLFIRSPQGGQVNLFYVESEIKGYLLFIGKENFWTCYLVLKSRTTVPFSRGSAELTGLSVGRAVRGHTLKMRKSPHVMLYLSIQSDFLNLFTWLVKYDLRIVITDFLKCMAKGPGLECTLLNCKAKLLNSNKISL